MKGLVLSRLQHETIRVDGPCLIEVCKVRGNRVSLRLIADRSVEILRGELIDEQVDTPKQQVRNALADDVSRTTL